MVEEKHKHGQDTTINVYDSVEVLSILSADPTQAKAPLEKMHYSTNTLINIVICFEPIIHFLNCLELRMNLLG